MDTAWRAARRVSEPSVAGAHGVTPRTLMWFSVVPQSFHVTVTAAWQLCAIVISARARKREAAMVIIRFAKMCVWCERILLAVWVKIR